ncbi:MAG: SDR family NAD(P)-dependent oxidoreductase [Phycisphaerales bacterium]|nr:SDR family NAD(P)-dependent oxidoreductase [Phycisphaerales bacterium]
MAIDLRGKAVCITGASSGIGRATAIECARAGMPVLAAARRLDKLEAVVGEIRSMGGRAAALAVDVTDAAACDGMIRRCVEEFGGVYSVFANAGYGFELPVHETDDARLRAIFEANFFGTMNTIRPALPFMLRAGAGHVLICSSCVSRMSLPYYGAYCATKAAQAHMGRAMNLELRGRGVYTSTVHPITTKTEFFDTARANSGGSAAILSKHTPDLFAQPAEKVARAVVRCLRRPRPEVWTSLFVRWGMAVAGAFPRLGDLGLAPLVKQRRKLEAEQA